METLTALDVPAVVLVGAEDTLSPPEDAEAMVDAMPDARLVRIPRAGHLSAMEDPATFNAAVSAFLAAQPEEGLDQQVRPAPGAAARPPER